jgi:hypothetical protein
MKWPSFSSADVSFRQTISGSGSPSALQLRMMVAPSSVIVLRGCTLNSGGAERIAEQLFLNKALNLRYQDLHFTERYGKASSARRSLVT